MCRKSRKGLASYTFFKKLTCEGAKPPQPPNKMALPFYFFFKKK